LSITISGRCIKCGFYWQNVSVDRERYEKLGIVCTTCNIKVEAKEIHYKPIESRFEILDL